jgi:hypothetical protein
LYYKVIKTAKYIFYKKEFSAANNNSRKIWYLSKQITGLGKSKGGSVIGEIQGCKTEKEKADAF